MPRTIGSGVVNRLADETSPYLQQHKDNPVDWYPWSDEAFARARAEDKPVLLSVGYSACHWCHVMAHESFEDDETAALMNDLFVNVKVDREERPDVDAVYMDAVQAMTGQGGWPMTMFLTPERRPFYGGTYYPPVARHGMPSFTDVCRAVDDAWRTRRDELVSQADKLTAALDRTLTVEGDATGREVGREVLDGAIEALGSQFDPQWGGFGRAPKFPHETGIELLLRASAGGDRPQLLELAVTTLDAMASGGIYDHLGGGFARYSVDNHWLVPHFEKMLYNQALLGRCYLHAWQITGEPRFLQVLDETITYVLRDLRHADGGFYSAEDADSEGVEGKFYVWALDEVTALLGDDARAAVEHWGVTAAGNFEGANILHLPERGALARDSRLEHARRMLFEARETRVRPGLDDKVLTEWNALFLATLAEAAAATGTQEWMHAATACAEFLLARLRRDDGRWLRSFNAGRAHHLAYAADYAAIVDAFTRLGEATGSRRWTDVARESADAMLELFWDEEGGGLFTTGHDAERLIARAKDVLDNATPAANSLAAVALLRLGALVGEPRYEERAGAIIDLLVEPLVRQPTAFAHLLAAVDLTTASITEIAVVGDRLDLVRAVQARYLPNAVLAWGEPYPSPLFAERKQGLAYVCENYACKQPAGDVESLMAQLTNGPGE
jgi:uncharacterized protein YyaL (SSP411 family)